MKERPIIMSSESVKAILAGRKTQTRRVCKLQSAERRGDGFIYKDGQMYYARQPCYPGDRLWVKEKYGYGYDGDVVYCDSFVHLESEKEWDRLKQWKNPMFMPKHLSRITLEVKSVRLVRLQDISDMDILAEGYVIPFRKEPIDVFWKHWNTLNAKRGFSWFNNPWVWVIEFKKIE